MRRCLVLYGVTCIVGQVLTLRELTVLFHGNELVYGATLASWLLLFALGSGLLGRVAERRRLGVSAFAVTLAGGGALVPATILLARSARWIVIGRAGVAPSLGKLLLATVTVLTPLCLLLGFFYALACAIEIRKGEGAAAVATRVYVFEGVGMVAGGVLLTYLLIHVLDGFRIALLIAAVNALAAFAVCRHAGLRSRPWGWALLLASLLWLGGSLTPVGIVVNVLSQKSRFPGRVLRESLDTAYGRIDVVEGDGQVEFYQSGVLVGATEMDRSAEESAYLPLLAHPQPRRVLLIGGYVTGVLHKTMALPWLRADCVELDPGMIELGRRFLESGKPSVLDSPRVRMFADVDGRFFVKRGPPAYYDVIISTVPNPTTGLINRFYTAEFFEECRRLLSANGVLALTISGSPAYMSGPHRALAASVYRTLGMHFDSVVALPSDSAILYLASPSRRAGLAQSAEMVARLKRWRIPTTWLSEGVLRELTEVGRVKRLHNVLRGAPLGWPNTDLHPVAYYQALLLWAEAFRTPGRWLLTRLLALDLGSAAFAVAIVTGLLCLAATFAPRPVWVGLPAVRVYSGMAAFVLQMVLVFAFQSLYGYAYSHIALIFAAFMVGMTLGALTTGRWKLAGGELRVLMLLQCMLAFVAGAMVPILRFLGNAGPGIGQAGAMLVIPFLNICVGALVGAEYPVSVAAGCRGVKRLTRPASLVAALYAMDIAGACLGALVGGVLLIPVLGIPRTCWAMAALSVASLPLLVLSERRHP